MGVAQFLLCLLISKWTLQEQCNWYDCKYVLKFCFICIYMNLFLFCKTDCSLTIRDKKSCRTDFWEETWLWITRFLFILFDRASEDIEEDDFEAVQRNTEILKSVSYSSFYIIFFAIVRVHLNMLIYWKRHLISHA